MQPLDVSMFEMDDYVNIVLQRSEVLTQLGHGQAAIRHWQNGDPSAIRDVVAADPEAIAHLAAEVIHREFLALKGLLDRLSPTSIADIGCGYAIFDLFAYQAYDSELLLVDIEGNDLRHFGFKGEGAAYSSLTKAKAFLTANGIPEAKIHLWNPNKGDMPDVPQPDLAVSFLSCGFHYPLDMYLPFFQHSVSATGSVILDLRRRAANEGIVQLQALGRVRELETEGPAKRVLLRKGRA